MKSKKIYLIQLVLFIAASCGPVINKTIPYSGEVKLKVPFEPNLGETCFSSSLAMVMRYWGKDVHVDDVYKIAGPPPFDGYIHTKLNLWMQKKFGLKFQYIPNSTIKEVKLYLNERHPVIVNQTFSLNQNTGHSRVVTGYSDKKGVFIINDPSSLGSNYEISYIDFRRLWWTISITQKIPSNSLYLIKPVSKWF